MIFIPTEHLQPGMVLAKDIYIYASNPFYMPLLTKGQVLSDYFIEKILDRNISGAYIESSIFNDVTIDNVIDEELKCRAISDVVSFFNSVHTNDRRNIEANIASMRELAKNLVLCILSNDRFLINLIDLKSYDDYTYCHSLCVAILSVTIGISLGLRESVLNELAMSALLHDIGKLDIPIEIINKKEKLSDDEFIIIKGHPKNAVERLTVQRLVPATVLSGVLTHHEKCDGTGYPQGLIEDKIPYFGKILAVADVYDALTSNRSYRKAWFPSEAIEYMMGCTGTHFDEDILKAFLKNVAAYPLGTFVSLSNGQTAIVVKNQSENTLRPVVRIVDPLAKQYKDIDLLDRAYTNITIVGMGYECKDVDYNNLTNVDEILNKDMP